MEVVGRNRRRYKTGDQKGEQRVSRAVRMRRRNSRLGISGGSADGEDAAMERLALAMESECLGEEELLSERIFRLGQGVREGREEKTFYEVDKGRDSMWGRTVGLEDEEVRSGRRWFRVEYPDSWRQLHTTEGCREKVAKSLEDYGKEFVEYGGKWYEVEREVVL